MTGFNELRQRLLHPYYVLHLAYGLAYIVTRSNQLIGQSFNLEVSNIHTNTMGSIEIFKTKSY